MRKINIFPNIFNYQTQKTTSVGNDTLYLLQEGCFAFLCKNIKYKHVLIFFSKLINQEIKPTQKMFTLLILKMSMKKHSSPSPPPPLTPTPILQSFQNTSDFMKLYAFPVFLRKKSSEN